MARNKKEGIEEVKKDVVEVSDMSLEENDAKDCYVKKDDFRLLSNQMDDITAALTVITKRYADKEEQEVSANTVNPGKIVDLDDIGKGSLDKLTDTEFYPEAIALTEFMNQYVTIRVDPPRDQNDYSIFPVSVNTRFQPIIKGADQRVRRKYVEVLFRCRNTDYYQPKSDKGFLVNVDTINQLVPTNKLVCPFMIIEDKDPRGKAWSDHLRNEAF